MKAYQYFAEALREHSFHTLFGLMGDANMQFIAHYVDALGGRYIASTHEAGAITMADGFHRISGEVTVATVTHGPGITNSVTALTEACRARSQILVITGDTPSVRTWSQSIDIGAVVAPTGAGYERVFGAESMVVDVARAVHRVRTEKRPVVLNLPYEIMQQVIRPISANSGPKVAFVNPLPDMAALGRTLDIIVNSKRPLVLAGRGAVISGAHEELIELSELLGAPVATSLLGREFFDGDSLNIGIAGGLSTRIASEAIAASDCIIAFGAGLNRYTTDNGALSVGKRIVQIDIDPINIGLYTRVDEVLIGDARQVAGMIVESLNEADFKGSGWGHRFAQRIADWTPESEFDGQSTDETVDVRTAVVQLDRVLPKDRNVVTDVGRFALAGWRYLRVSDPTRFTHMSNFGSIGLGLGAGIGAALVDPTRLTVALMGDGGFMMSVGEFTTAVRYRVPMLVVVLNDRAYGAETAKLHAHGESGTHSFIDWPDLAGLATAMGGRAMTVRSSSDFDRVTDLVAGLDGPALIDVRLERTTDFS